MSLNTKLIALAQAMGADVKALTAAQGNLATLPTTAKDSLVAAITELHGLIAAASNTSIDDTAGNGDVDVTWSADKIFDTIELAKQAVKSDILGGADAAYDTLKELQDALQQDQDAVVALTGAVGNRVRFDEAQVLTTEQKSTARTNIGAASAADLTALATSLGDVEADLAALYAQAKA